MEPYDAPDSPSGAEGFRPPGRNIPYNWIFVVVSLALVVSVVVGMNFPARFGERREWNTIYQTGEAARMSHDRECTRRAAAAARDFAARSRFRSTEASAYADLLAAEE